MKSHLSPYVNKRKRTIEFHITISDASRITLTGSFNRWAQDELCLKKDRTGSWKIEIPMLPQGTYHYKFRVDEKMWIEDIENPLREPDGVFGWNSVLRV